MKSVKIIAALLIAAGLLASCGSEKNTNAAAKFGKAEKSDSSLLGGKNKLKNAYYIANAPAPCLRLSEDVVKKIFSASSVVGMPNNSGSVSCSYREDGGDKYIAATMQFYLKDIVDSSKAAPQALKQFATDFYAGRAYSEEPSTLDLGIETFVFQNNKQTSLVVFTGIGGLSPLGTSISNELVLGYNLQDTTRTREERLRVLEKLAREQFAELDELARTTHGET